MFRSRSSGSRGGCSGARRTSSFHAAGAGPFASPQARIHHAAQCGRPRECDGSTAAPREPSETGASLQRPAGWPRISTAAGGLRAPDTRERVDGPRPPAGSSLFVSTAFPAERRFTFRTARDDTRQCPRRPARRPRLTNAPLGPRADGLLTATRSVAVTNRPTRSAWSAWCASRTPSAPPRSCTRPTAVPGAGAGRLLCRRLLWPRLVRSLQSFRRRRCRPPGAARKSLRKLHMASWQTSHPVAPVAPAGPAVDIAPTYTRLLSRCSALTTRLSAAGHPS